MIYEVRLMEQAKYDLRGIYEYLAFEKQEPEIALKLRNRIVTKLSVLGENPEKYALYQEEPWKSRGLRRINLENYCGFYLVAEKHVHVLRILYGGMDIDAQLKRTKYSDSMLTDE